MQHLYKVQLKNKQQHDESNINSKISTLSKYILQNFIGTNV